MMKRLLAVILSALMVVNISGCNNVDKEYENIRNSNQNLTNHQSMQHQQKNEISNFVHSTENTPLMVDFKNYDSIVSTYRKIVELCPRYEEVKDDDYFIFEDDTTHDLYNTIFSSALHLYPRDSSGINGNCYEQFGYTIKDLNQDGIDELILRLNNHVVIAIFTMVNNQPVLLDYYWNRKNCWIDPDGYLHVGGSSGADKSVVQIYRISDQTGELILLEEGGTDGHDETSGNTLYYKLINNEKVYITKEEYNSWQQNLMYKKFEVTETISEYMPCTPLFDQNHPAPEPYVPRADG